MSSPSAPVRPPFAWVPSLYLAMGIPFNVIMSGTAVRMYKDLGYGDGAITVALGSIGIAWSLKPLWAAFLDMYRTKRFFVLTMEFVISLLLAAVALTLPLPGFFQISIAVLWVTAFASSTQDICADGIYLTALNKENQAKLAGVQSTFWVTGKVLASGLVITAMGWLAHRYAWSTEQMWQGVFITCAALMGLLGVYHLFFLPVGSKAAVPEGGLKTVVHDFLHTGVTFFHKRAFWGMILFVFLYRIGEGMILMEGQLFLQSPVEQGGLGLTAVQVSNIDALWGTIANIVGGLLGGLLVARRGLSKSLWMLGLALNVPHVTFVILSQLAAPHHGLDVTTVGLLVCVEKFGYGFGMVGNMIYMMQQLAPGRSAMTHYAFATALMNLMLVPTNMVSGPLAEWLGFEHYFLVVMVASVPSIWAAWQAPFPLDKKAADGREEDGIITVNDETRISPAERTLQVLAGKASMFAMLMLLVLLVVDTNLLGRFQGLAQGQGGWILGALGASLVVKLWLGARALAWVRTAKKEAQALTENTYAGNARGALITTVLCAFVGVGTIAFGAWRVLG